MKIYSSKPDKIVTSNRLPFHFHLVKVSGAIDINTTTGRSVAVVSKHRQDARY